MFLIQRRSSDVFLTAMGRRSLPAALTSLTDVKRQGVTG